jgi:hypothetical protein
MRFRSALVALLTLSCVDSAGITSSGGLVVTIPSNGSITVGDQIQVTATAAPGISAPLSWSSSNESVATVTQSGIVTGVTAGSATISASAGENSGSATVNVVEAAGAAGAVLLAAGDIATCTNDFDEATARILDANPSGVVAPLGDNAYVNGSASDYANCYAPTWGRHLARTMPAVGNHEYQTPDATGYYGYFGAKAGDPAKGYYSYDLGAWHIVVLNSNIAHDAGSPQLAWLRADLQSNRSACTLAYWHHPRFSSGNHGNDSRESAIWDALFAYDADVILNGHEHNYERFAPQTPAGVADNSRGIRAFIVGTGGTLLRAVGTPKANSEVFNSASHGILKLTLSADSYAWQFLAIAGQSFTDSGSGACH